MDRLKQQMKRDNEIIMRGTSAPVMANHPIAVDTFPSKIQEKCQAITKITRLHHIEAMHACTKCF